MAAVEIDSVTKPLVNNIFMLRVDAIFDLACTRISGIESEKEYENIMEGGVNDYVQLREKPSTKVKVLEIERYIGERYIDPLPVGRKPILPLILYVSRYLNDFSNSKMVFTFTGCTVLSKKFGELDAERSGLMTEKTSIAYQSVVVVPDFIDNVKASWGFDVSGKDYKGIGKRNAQFDQSEFRKKDMLELGRKWPTTRSARKI
jgi:hypothetical protein